MSDEDWNYLIPPAFRKPGFTEKPNNFIASAIPNMEYNLVIEYGVEYLEDGVPILNYTVCSMGPTNRRLFFCVFWFFLKLASVSLLCVHCLVIKSGVEYLEDGVPILNYTVRFFISAKLAAVSLCACVFPVRLLHCSLRGIRKSMNM